MYLRKFNLLVKIYRRYSNDYNFMSNIWKIFLALEIVYLEWNNKNGGREDGK